MNTTLYLHHLYTITANNSDVAGAMVWTDWVWRLGIVLALIFLTAFFVASEYAIEKIRGIDLEDEVKSDDAFDYTLRKESRSYRIARSIAENPEKFLSATRMGMTTTMLMLGLVTVPALAEPLEMWITRFGWVSSLATDLVNLLAATFSVVLVLCVLVIFGELIPKSIGIRHPVATVLRCGGALVIFRQILYPLSAVLEKLSAWLMRTLFGIRPVREGDVIHSAEELQMLVNASGKDTDVTATEREIVVNALELSDLCARDIMTPRSEVIALDIDQTFEENVRQAVASRHTRFPIARGHLDSAVGMVHIKDMLRLASTSVNGERPKGETSLMSIKRELLPVPEKLTLDRLLEFFLKEHAHLALVVDEFGGTVGVVFLDDVMAELVGDIHDEFDEEIDEFHRVSDDEFFVDGGLGLYELADFTDLELNSEDVSTIGGYVTHMLGHVPRSGERFEVPGFRGTVTKANGRRVVQLHFKRLMENETEAEKLAHREDVSV